MQSAGGVYRDGKGWRAVLPVRSESGKRSRRLVRRAKTKAEAIIKLSELLVIRDTSPEIALHVDRVLVGEWIKSCLKDSDVATKTRLQREAFVKHLAPLFSFELRRLTPGIISDVVAGINTSRNRQGAFDLLKRTINKAVRDDHLAKNPCDRVDRPKYTPADIHPFTPKERDSILHATRDHRLKAVFLIAFACGLRAGECWGLQWVDVFDGGIHVKRQVVEASGQLEIKPPKTKHGIRTILLPDTVMQAIEQRRCDALREGHGKVDWIFPGRTGKPKRHASFRMQWSDIQKQIGIKPRGWHHVRHTAATQLLSAGIGIHVVSKIIGHSKVSITLDVYSHLMHDQQEAARDAMVKMVG